MVRLDGSKPAILILLRHYASRYWDYKAVVPLFEDIANYKLLLTRFRSSSEASLSKTMRHPMFN